MLLLILADVGNLPRLCRTILRCCSSFQSSRTSPNLGASATVSMVSEVCNVELLVSNSELSSLSASEGSSWSGRSKRHVLYWWPVELSQGGDTGGDCGGGSGGGSGGVGLGKVCQTKSCQFPKEVPVVYLRVCQKLWGLDE